MRRLVAQAVRETLLKFHTVHARKEPAPVQSSTLPVTRQLRLPSLPATPELPRFPRRKTIAPAVSRRSQMKFPPGPRGRPARIQPHLARKCPPGRAARPVSAPRGSAYRRSVPLLNVPLRLVGVIGKLYVVLESDRGLVLLDQHAAHERILFEQMLNRLEQQGNAAVAKTAAAGNRRTVRARRPFSARTTALR